MKFDRSIRLTALTAAIITASSWSIAQEATLYESHVLPEGMIFEPTSSMAVDSMIELVVQGPNDFYMTKSFEAGQAIEFNPAALAGKSLADGSYRYELRVTGINGLSANRDSGKPAITELPQGGFGSFSILDGKLVSPTASEAKFEGDGGGITLPVAGVQAKDGTGDQTRDQVFNDDLIVSGSLCVGFDCVNGETFGFDTIRLKENNTRIRFFDTSSSGSFPTNDWQLTANDSANGGANKFSIDDIDGGRTPFTILAGAPSHSLFVNASGRIGMGTSTPAVEMHALDGDTPTLRLQQDGSSGFASQVWDMAGNETNFFIRDVSNGSTLPFRIQPGAASNVIYIASDEQTGFGTTSPTAPIDVNAGTNIGPGNSAIRASNASGAVGLQLDPNNDGTFWFITANSDNDTFRINRNGGTGEVEFEIEQSTGNLTIPGSIITGGGTCGGGCDFVFTDQYKLPTIEEHSEAMWENGYLPNVGPTVENQPINLSEKTGRMLNELETAHIYIEQLHKRLAKLEAKLEGVELN